MSYEWENRVVIGGKSIVLIPNYTFIDKRRVTLEQYDILIKAKAYLTPREQYIISEILCGATIKELATLWEVHRMAITATYNKAIRKLQRIIKRL